MLDERWTIEEAAGHRRTEARAGALQEEVARGMLFTSRKNNGIQVSSRVTSFASERDLVFSQDDGN